MTENIKSFGAEIRLNSGQLAQVVPGGTIEILPEPPPPDTFHYQMTAYHAQTLKPLLANADDYNSLIQFLKQLEPMGYTLTQIERIANVPNHP